MSYAYFQIVLLATLGGATALTVAAACVASARLGFGWLRGLLVVLPLVHLWLLHRAGRAAAPPAEVSQAGSPRRAFLAGAAAIAVAGLTGVLRPRSLGPTAFLPPEVDPSAVARSYLRLPGAVEAMQPLAKLLLDGAAGDRAAIGRRIVEDYARHSVVVADGWVLSETEAQLCVLAAQEGGRT